MTAVEKGAYNTPWTSTAKNVTNGGFCEPVGKTGQTDVVTTDRKLQEQLWEWTEKELAEY